MSVDFIDLGELHKKGILKKEIINKSKLNSNDVIDFTKSTTQNSSKQINKELDFLSSFAKIGADNNEILNNNKDYLENSNEQNIFQSLNEQKNNILLKIDGINNKLDDVMYKIENLTGRIVKLELKIDSK